MDVGCYQATESKALEWTNSALEALSPRPLCTLSEKEKEKTHCMVLLDWACEAVFLDNDSDADEARSPWSRRAAHLIVAMRLKMKENLFVRLD